MTSPLANSGPTTHCTPMTTSDHTAQTWRDVPNQLTAAQIAQLERLERDEPGTLLEMARQSAANNMISGDRFDDVAPPTSAECTFAWQLDTNRFRDFEGTTRVAAGRPAFRSSADSRAPGHTGRDGDPRTGDSADRCGRRNRAARLSSLGRDARRGALAIAPHISLAPLAIGGPRHRRPQNHAMSACGTFCCAAGDKRL